MKNNPFTNISKKNDISNSEKVLFNSHCIQLFEVFFRIIGSHSNQKKQISEINLCCSAFMQYLGIFETVILHPHFCVYITETVRELTAVIINNKQRCNKKTSLIKLRDHIVNKGIHAEPYNLPRLLMARQTQGPMVVHQHTLLLKKLVELYNISPETLQVQKFINQV